MDGLADEKSKSKKILASRGLNLETYHIHINGIVQGVGFRPLVYQLASQRHLHGFVRNGSNGVHICINAGAGEAISFFKQLKENPPVLSKITSMELNRAQDTPYADFSIGVGEPDNAKKMVLISPDTATCSSCLAELRDKNDRRYRYPFITCTTCGPRYSILEELPYERQGTTMAGFILCAQCRREYEQADDRRFFSQTNSCGECGVKLSVREKDADLFFDGAEPILQYIREAITAGKILAVKGIGGFLLLCDANNKTTISLLRKRKNRPAKPFALLYPDEETLRPDFTISREEWSALKSKEAPIVLLYPNKEAPGRLCIGEIAPSLNRLGVMLPYSPLLHLIAGDYKKPLVATSGNCSGSPIIYRDQEAATHLPEIADIIIGYNREISIPQDDSVLSVSPHTGLRTILRRSRGLAPSFLQYRPVLQRTALAMGALMKSSFTVSVNGNVFISQYLGSGTSFESEQMYKEVLDYWMRLYEIKPDLVIADLHPGYFSHGYGKLISEACKAPLVRVQHHEAHFAAVLAENELLGGEEAVLGIIWDGTGLGRDGHIWGGEFFIYKEKSMTRRYHFDRFPVIAGDKMSREPRISALCIAGEYGMQSDILREKFTGTEWKNYQALINGSGLLSSSAGRIFDAAASLLGCCDKQSYEGEAAMQLQALAETHIQQNGFFMDEPYAVDDRRGSLLSGASLLRGILIDLKKERPKSYIAARFHYSLVCLVGKVAEKTGTGKICFSGGVFQNGLLTDWIQEEYGKKYQLYFHKNLSPNDENISFGQLVYQDNRISGGEAGTGIPDKLFIHQAKNKYHVSGNPG